MCWLCRIIHQQRVVSWPCFILRIITIFFRIWNGVKQWKSCELPIQRKRLRAGRPSSRCLKIFRVLGHLAYQYDGQSGI